MNQSVLREHWTEKAARSFWIVLVSVAAGALTGLTIGLAGRPMWSSMPMGVIFGLYIGGAAGLVLSGIVVPLLYYRPLAIALPLVYVPTWIGCSVLLRLLNDWVPPVIEIETLIVAGGCTLNIALAVVARLVLPKVRRDFRWGGFCPFCDYDLTGNISGVCPECGAAVAQPKLPATGQTAAHG